MSKIKSFKQKTNYFFNQFYKDFLRPYGEATNRLATEDIKRKLHPFNCEFLKRPAVALSEFSETLTAAYDRLNENLETFVEKDIKTVMETLYLLFPAAAVLNVKSGQTATKKEIKAALKQIYNLLNGDLSEELRTVTSYKGFFKSMKSFMHIGASMYLIGVHFYVLKFIFSNMKFVKETVKTKASEGNKFSRHFKAWSEKKQKGDVMKQGYLEVALKEYMEMSEVKRKSKNLLDSSTEESNSSISASSEEESDSDRFFATKEISSKGRKRKSKPEIGRKGIRDKKTIKAKEGKFFDNSDSESSSTTISINPPKKFVLEKKVDNKIKSDKRHIRKEDDKILSNKSESDSPKANNNIRKKQLLETIVQKDIKKDNRSISKEKETMPANLIAIASKGSSTSSDESSNVTKAPSKEPIRKKQREELGKNSVKYATVTSKKKSQQIDFNKESLNKNSVTVLKKKIKKEII